MSGPLLLRITNNRNRLRVPGPGLMLRVYSVQAAELVNLKFVQSRLGIELSGMEFFLTSPCGCRPCSFMTDLVGLCQRYDSQGSNVLRNAARMFVNAFEQFSIPLLLNNCHYSLE